MPHSSIGRSRGSPFPIRKSREAASGLKSHIGMVSQAHQPGFKAGDMYGKLPCPRSEENMNGFGKLNEYHCKNLN